MLAVIATFRAPTDEQSVAHAVPDTARVAPQTSSELKLPPRQSISGIYADPFAALWQI
jgi:hypothetical protein